MPEPKLHQVCPLFAVAQPAGRLCTLDRSERVQRILGDSATIERQCPLEIRMAVRPVSLDDKRIRAWGPLGERGEIDGPTSLPMPCMVLVFSLVIGS